MNALGNNGKARIVITPRRGALLAAQDNVLEVLIQVRAPDPIDQAPKTRPPMGVALVIDRSGSMGGAPLHEAKRCCEFVAERLRADDTLALVQFDRSADVLCNAGLLKDKQGLHDIIASISTGGNTNLHGGWLAGAEQLAPAADGTQIQRVILLSDGQANEGVVVLGEITQQCRALADAGVTTSTYGLGSGFNEELMVAMAEAGRGNHYYGATAEDLFEPFTRELDLLADLWIRHVTLSIGSAKGVEVSMLNSYQVGQDPGTWQLPDIAVGSEAWALLRLRIPRECVQTGESLLHVHISGRDMAGATEVWTQDMAALPALPSEAYIAVAENSEVAARAAETEAADMLLRCRKAAYRGEWPVVDAMLAEAAKRFESHPWVSSVIATMTQLAAARQTESLAKDSYYSSRAMASRLRALAESGSLLAEVDQRSFLRRSTSYGTAEYVRRARTNSDPSK